MQDCPRYFLGANAPGGFYSLYSDMLPPEEARAIYILKGGPGCGKSTLMRAVEKRALEAGLLVEEILCSGDPDSLDAVILPEQRIAVTDGTAPHVMEAKYPGAVERYINLGDCYDSAALYPIREELFAAKAAYQASYRRAYRCLEAAASLLDDARAPLLTPVLEARLAARARGVLTRELPPIRGAAPGKARRRFLSTPTHRGTVALFDTACGLCPRVYQLADCWGLGHRFLLELLTAAVERGYHPIACPDPMAPDRLAHLLVPEAGAAFLTSPAPLPEKPYRRFRIDAMADPEIEKQNRPRLKFSRRVSDALLAEGIACLAEAKAGHDRLEAIYHPHVDFARVGEYTDAVIAELFSLF